MTKQHKWHKEIKAWADGAEIEYKFVQENNVWSEWEITNRPYFDERSDYKYRIKSQGTKCITKDCENHTSEGKFVGDLCKPCWDYIVNGKGVYSQAYRNAQPKKPKYLYVYESMAGITFSKHKGTTTFCIGKIKLEVQDD